MSPQIHKILYRSYHEIQETMFENFKENGLKVVAFTGARLTFTYPHECIGNIVNSAGVKAN